MTSNTDSSEKIFNSDRNHRQLLQLGASAEENIYRDIDEICFEDNYFAPGGWGQLAQGNKIMEESLLQMSRQYSPWQSYQKLFQQYMFDVDQITTLGEFLLYEAKMFNRNSVVIVIGDKRYFHPKTEIQLLVDFFKQRNANFSFIYIIDLLNQVDHGEIKPEEHLFYCYYNDSEIKAICEQENLQFPEIWSKIQASGTQNILGREDLNLSDRSWVAQTNIDHEHSIFKRSIRSQDLVCTDNQIYYQDQSIDLSKMVLKMEASFGGHGVYLPHQLSVKLVEQIISENHNFVLEYFARQPVTYQPLSIFSPRTNKENSFYHPKFLTELLVDTRITFLVTSDRQFKLLNYFFRASYSGTPTNLACGGIFLCSWIVPDRDFLTVFEKVNRFWSQVNTSEYNQFVDLIKSGLESQGVVNPKSEKPYNFGLIPYLISESSTNRLIEYAKSWTKTMTHLYEQKGRYHKPFFITLDFSLNPYLI